MPYEYKNWHYKKYVKSNIVFVLCVCENNNNKNYFIFEFTIFAEYLKGSLSFSDIIAQRLEIKTAR